MPLFPRYHSAALVVLLLVAGLALSSGLAWHLAGQAALRREQTQALRQLDLHAQALQQRIDRYRTLPQVLALDPELRLALSQPVDDARRHALNRKLEQANNVTRTSTLTLVDSTGEAIAASNWRSSFNNVGENYAFRPYFQRALAEGEGQFYGIGLTTGQPGYFLSQAIHDAAGTTLGVIVIKIELDSLEREWLDTSPDIVLVSDEHDVVFLASRDTWRYRSLRPLDTSDHLEIQASRQYIGQPLPALVLDTQRALGPGAHLVRMRQPALPGMLLWQDVPLQENRWRLHLLHDTSAVILASRTAALAVGGAWLALAFLLLYMQQRQRLAAHRQRSREELETVLRQHAEELRTAQDGIVQAAQQADAGLSRSLEHLPQGVVIIDAQLNLVAWNSRYVELFRLPPELVQVGRPIEAIFRYNARRGLLGPGPAEEAIQRRLAHLRSGSPHMRESEKEDGTVLEIRGNPLPDGGFVTSYADITSYKNAARELRSLADALERRIEERTRDLAQAKAKAEAETANRYKSRFVASAVHDLLQPLNAARMFLSVLRGKLAETEARQIVEHAEQALAAQDAILNSLLDIARLEAGSLHTHAHDFPLEPLLQALAREFGIVAEGRGLTLEHVPASAVVRSDPALLRRILQNYLSNAIRYTPRGRRVLLGCRRAGKHLRIEVHDQGPGIPEGLQQEIFEEFRRLDDGVINDRGAGLGLAIVQRIGRLLGHRIGLRSRLGHGSVFWVRVPLGNPAHASMPASSEAIPPAVEASPLHGCKVWYIDEDARACEAARSLLLRWECEAGPTTDPASALAAARPGNAPDLLLLDVGEGKHDGPALYPQLCARWQAEPSARPAVILVTAEHDEGLHALASENGWGFLPKPIKPAALRALMTQLHLRQTQSR